MNNLERLMQELERQAKHLDVRRAAYPDYKAKPTNPHMLSLDKQIARLSKNRDLMIKQAYKAMRKQDNLRFVKLVTRLSDTMHRLETCLYKQRS